MSGDRNDYEVGRGKPPEHTRFRKGQSGNPKGRPKGRRDFNKEIEEVLSAHVVVTENGRPRKVSSRMATLMRLREKALKGDGRAMDRLLELATQHELARHAAQTERALSSTDDAILERYAQSLKVQPGTEPGGDGDVE
jgi:hypothetical protein